MKYYVSNIIACSDYYPFGMVMPERNGGSSYRYGFGSHENDDEVSGNGNHLSFGDYGYNPRLARRFNIDPMIGSFPWMSPYATFNNSPILYKDPNGESPISVLAKLIAKKGAKYAKKQIEGRLKKYMSKKMYKQFLKDLDDVVNTLESSWYETAFELVPIAGDIYGAGAFGIKVAKAWKKMQEVENKYISKIEKAMPNKLKKKFKKNMRNSGVRDARKDQKAGIDNGKKYIGDGKVDGHHIKSVQNNPELMSDPSNIRFMKKNAHKRYHKWRNKIDMKDLMDNPNMLPEIKIKPRKK